MPSQIIFFDQPRSGSHLLVRMLAEKQSTVKILSHPYSPCRSSQVSWLSSKDYEKGMAPETLQAFEASVKKGTDAWQSALTESFDASRILLMQSHLFVPVTPETLLSYNNLASSGQSGPLQGENFTMLPEEILLRPGSIPLFSIRDPRLAVPSAYRTMEKMSLKSGGGRPHYLAVTNLIWTRVLYDYYVSHGIEPVVVDFDSLVDPAFIPQLCGRLGLNPDFAQLSWDPLTNADREAIHPMYYASQSTMLESSSFLPGKAAQDVNFDSLERQWTDEFGDDAALVKEMVVLTTSHYHYLYDRRLKF